jgi:microcin C transport system permease protein
MKFNPITRKRLNRFRRLRRAYAAVWLLGALVLLALGADLICNEKPLYIRFNGCHYFPAWRFYPESAFLPGGNPTAPDYKQLNRHPVFTGSKRDFMIFAPIPYGPRETIDEQSIRAERDTEVILLPIPRAGNLDLTADLRIVRQLAAGFFLGRDGEDIRGRSLGAEWDLPEAVRAAMRQRFANQAAPGLRVPFTSPSLPDLPLELALSPFTPRPDPPATVRLTIRAASGPALRRSLITLDREGQPDATSRERWASLDPASHEKLLTLVEASRAGAVDPVDVQGGHFRYHATIDTAVSWPHAPVRGHWLGIDSAGRDVLARLLHGLRVSLVFSVLLVIASMSIGITVGAIQGYYGGITDILTQRGIEIWSAIPFLYVMILLGSVYGARLWLLLLCYAIFNWIGISFYIRAEFLRLRGQPFVDAAKVLGVRDASIIFRHILPNAITPVITFAPFSLVGAIAALASLDFLGFGLPALTPSIGQLLHQAQTHRTAWWLILYPSLTLFTVILLGVFIGEGVREAYDPRPRSRLE